jgi:hypothetical protein
MARLGHWLSTLRPVGCPHRTQDSLPVADQGYYRVGLVTHRVPSKGFRSAIVTSLPPFPSLLGAMSVHISDPFWAARKINRPQSLTMVNAAFTIGDANKRCMSSARKFGAMAQAPEKTNPPTTYVAPHRCARWRNGAADRCPCVPVAAKIPGKRKPLAKPPLHLLYSTYTHEPISVRGVRI